MTVAVPMAGLAGCLVVLAAWDGLAVLDQQAFAQRLHTWLAPLRTGRSPSAAERRRLVAVVAVTLLSAGWLVGGPVVGLVVATAAPVAAARAIAWRRRRRRRELARAAPAVARALADALSGGHSVQGAVLAAARDGAVGGAAGHELRAAAAALELGEATTEVLERLRDRAGDRAWDTVVAAVLLQRDAGGDLAALLRGLAERLEAAHRADADAHSATAQARFTAWLVAALPAVAAGLAELGSPGYLASLAGAPLTGLLAATSVGLQLVAVLAIRRIARVGA